jgi:hypothetical protein
VKGFGKEVRDRLSAAGCEFVRHVPVKIMSRHMANKILMDAGLPKEF